MYLNTRLLQKKNNKIIQIINERSKSKNLEQSII